MDSAFEWRYTYKGGAKLLRFVVVPTLFFSFVSMGIDIAAIFFKSDFITILFTVIELVGCIWFILILFMSNWKKVVPGALDDLTGVFTAGALMRYFSENNIRFEDTEVIVLATGSEEAGLRGAMDFAKKHSDELSGAETIFIGLDTLAEKEHIGVNIKDMCSTVKLSEKAYNLVSESAKNVGYEIPFSKVGFGATDAAAMACAGISATTITAMDPAPGNYYHTRRDTPDLLKRDVIEETLRICIETVYQFAEG
ncbi:hypothetical protein SDC9_114857 [bioreactor metagenome]|uniref:Peptidase M28 domain-containing protein n=1 Tax=bioreactor metagenome TaxID=1076179 RepID=A0A645BRT2_9ZZZZ